MAFVGATRFSRSIDVVHLRAGADDPFEAELLVEPAIEFEIGAAEAGTGGGLFRDDPQLVHVERLEQVVERPLLHRLDGRGNRAVAGDENHFGVGLVVFGVRQHFEAADVVHHQVGDDDVELFLFELLQAFGAAAGGDAVEADPFQTVGHRQGVRLVVVDDQHRDRPTVRLGGSDGGSGRFRSDFGHAVRIPKSARGRQWGQPP